MTPVERIWFAGAAAVRLRRVVAARARDIKPTMMTDWWGAVFGSLSKTSACNSEGNGDEMLLLDDDTGDFVMMGEFERDNYNTYKA
jgi:hypothetical protein